MNKIFKKPPNPQTNDDSHTQEKLWICQKERATTLASIWRDVHVVLLSEKKKSRLWDEPGLVDFDSRGELSAGQAQAKCLKCITLFNLDNVHMRFHRRKNRGSKRWTHVPGYEASEPHGQDLGHTLNHHTKLY